MHLSDKTAQALLDVYARYPEIELDELIAFFCAENCEWRTPIRMDQWHPLGTSGKWLEPGKSKTAPWGGIFYGPDGIRDYFTQLNDMAATGFYDVKTHIRGPDSMVLRCHVSIDFGRTGTFEEYWTIDWWQFQDDKAIFFEEYFDTFDALRKMSVNGSARQARA